MDQMKLKNNKTTIFVLPSGGRVFIRFFFAACALFAIALTCFSVTIPSMPYRPIYWIIGAVADQGTIKADGHTVIFYKDPSTSADHNAQAVISDGKFMLNAFDIYPQELKVGETYQIEIAKGEDGWGSDPVEIVISADGKMDLANAITIKKGQGGETPPKTGEDLAAEADPNIKVWFGSRLYQKILVEKGKSFIIASDPELKIEVSIDQPFAISKNISDYSVEVNPGTSNQKAYAFTEKNVTSKSIASYGNENMNNLSLTCQFTEKLSEGKHTLRVSAKSAGNLGYPTTKTETLTVEVLGGPLRLIGTPLTFPSPFSISKQGNVTIQYELSANGNIDLYVVGVSGARAKKIFCNSGEEGGSAGINKATWDGKTDAGSFAGNGIYVVTVVGRDENKLLGKIKLTILD